MEFQLLIIIIILLIVINLTDSWSTSAKSANFNPMYRESKVDGKKWLNNELYSFSDFVASKPLLSANEEKKLGQAMKLALHLEKVMIKIQNESNITIPNDDNNYKTNIFNNDNNNITYFDDNSNTYFSRILTLDRDLTNKLAIRLECNTDMIDRIAINGDKAYETLVNSNLRLVLAVVGRYYYANVPISELIAEGTRGLSKAVRRYDFEKGFRFATYATWYVTQGVADYVRFKSNPTKIPSKYLLLRRNLKKFMPEYLQEHNCNPTLKEICEALGSCEVDIVKCLNIQTTAISLNEKLKGASSTNNNNDRTFEDVLQSQSAFGPDLQSSTNQLNRDITLAIERNLEKEEKDILQMRLGLGNTRAHSISEVAKKYEISWQKVRHLERQALNKLVNSTDLLMDQ